MSIKAKVVPTSGRQFAPGDPLHRTKLINESMRGAVLNLPSRKPHIVESLSSLYNTSVPLPMSAVLQVGVEERVKTAQVAALKRVDQALSGPDAFSSAPTPSPAVNAALEDLVTNFERARTDDAAPRVASMPGLMPQRSKPFAKPSTVSSLPTLETAISTLRPISKNPIMGASQTDNLKHAVGLGSRAAEHAAIVNHSEDLLSNNATILDDTENNHSAPDEVARSDFNDMVGDGEGDIQNNLNEHLTHCIQRIKDEVSTSNTQNAKTNADHCHTICAAADIHMHSQCAELSSDNRNQVVMDRFCKEMMGVILQILGRPDNNKGHVSKELIQHTMEVFVTLAKLVVGMSSHEARDVISLGTRELTETLKSAKKKHAPEGHTNEVLGRTHEFVAGNCRKLRSWFTFGKHDGEEFGSFKYVKELSDLAGGAQAFENGIKDASVNKLRDIREGLETSKKKLI